MKRYELYDGSYNSITGEYKINKFLCEINPARHYVNKLLRQIVNIKKISLCIIL